ncbi:dihydropyrimidinase [Flavimaricola marinus]|uniref:D-hydantoinase n=1 Tax=Flavimaricola marinus TaxID=1819565 RepID=A0A238LKI9_9RHOB|nr:dihydropyrimidinase [Flavimaricola marinus]SMY09914.1 D-hydantoinase [Flavimaricola marinus]
MAETFDMLIRGGRVVTPQGVVQSDLGLRDGRIAAMDAAGTAARVIDADGRYVMPGGVDPHAHIEQMSGMGVMNADTFETATRSAAMGGATSVISFAAQAKGERLTDTVSAYAARAAQGAMIDHAFHITVTDMAAPAVLTDLAALIGQGHRSIKVFTTYNIQLPDREILEIMAAARAAGGLVCVHAENDGLIGWTRDRLVAQGMTAPPFHAVSHPRMAEIEAVERMCRFAEFLGQPVMLFHISTAEGVAAVRAAKARGVPVWAETCPHYLFQTAEVLAAPGLEGAKWMCSPPQRTEADQAALWDGLADGTLALVSSDHAPYRMDASGKLSAGPEAGFHQIANGLPGLETRLPLLYDAMMGPDGAGPEAFARVTSAAAAELYGLSRKGRIAEGMDADLVIWDETPLTYGPDDLHDNVGYNPWEGRTVRARPGTVILRGQVIVEDGLFRGDPGAGQGLDRPALGDTPATNPAPEAALVLGVV